MRALGLAAPWSAEAEPIRIRVPLPDMVLPRVLRRPARFLGRIDITLPRHFGLKATGVLFLIVALYGVVVGDHVESMVGGVTAATGLKIDSVRITGQIETAELAVLEALAIPEHASMLTYDVNGARERVEAISWVGTADIRKVYPDVLEIQITEREPFALWQRNGEVVLIDVEGRILSNYVASRYRNLPVLVGAGAQSEAEEILALIGQFPTLHSRTRAATLVSGRRWDLTLTNGVRILLPEEDPVPALIQLESLDQARGLLSRDILTVDLRLADRIVVGLPDDVTEEVLDDVAAARRAGGG